jgi:hypothetical protein
MSTSVRIIYSWVVALGTGLLLRRLLPERRFVIIRGKVPHIISFNRFAFWGCILAGVVATVALLVKSMAGGRR